MDIQHPAVLDDHPVVSAQEEDLFVFNDTTEGPRRERESFIRNYSP